MNLFSCLIFAFLLFMILLVILRLLERCFWWRRDQHPRHVPISSKGREIGQLPEWLNDEDINGYLDLIVQRSQRNPNLPKVYSFSTFFYQKLVHSGFAGVSRWTKKVNIFEYDLLLVPIHHMGNHWCMVVIDFEQRQMVYYDSMLQDNEACLAKLRDYLVEEAKDKKGRKLAFGNWTFECRKGIPYQTNNCDCGVFACMFAEYVSRCAPITFSQTHIPYFRDRMAYELSNQKLL